MKNLSTLLWALSILVALSGCHPGSTPAPTPSKAVPPKASPTPEDVGEWKWRVYLSSFGVIHSGRVSTTGAVDALTASKYDEVGPPTTRMVMNGDKVSFKQETMGVRFRFLGVMADRLLASESYGSVFFSLPLEAGQPGELKPTELTPIVMSRELLPETRSVYLSDGRTSSIIHFQLNESGEPERKGSYQTNASIPRIEIDPATRTLWVAEGQLTSFDLAADPDLKKPKVLLEGDYKGVKYIPGSKQLVLEIEVEADVLSDKAFEIYSVTADGLKKEGLVQPKPDAFAYGFTDDGKWMLVGGSHAEDKLWSYRLQEGKITLVDTLEIASGADRLDVYENLILIDRRDTTIIVKLGDDGKLKLCQALLGSGAILAPLE